MQFLYGSAFMSQSPEAYERLILDVMRGDATLFPRDDEVDAQWSDHRPDPARVGGPTGRAARAEPRGGYRRTAGGDDAAGPTRVARIWRSHWLDRGTRATSPSAIEAALRNLLAHLAAIRRTACVPPRVMNLRDRRAPAFPCEVGHWLARVGRYHPSRLIIAAVEEGRTQIDAWATVAAEDAVHKPKTHRGRAGARGGRLGPQLLDAIDSIVDPLLVSDLTTMVWAPHGHAAGVDALRRSPASS